LPCLQGGVPGRGDRDEQVAVPLDGLGELDIERFSCPDHVAVGQDHLPDEGPCDVRDHCDPVTTPELDWVGVVVDVDVGEHREHLLHRYLVTDRDQQIQDRLCELVRSRPAGVMPASAIRDFVLRDTLRSPGPRLTRLCAGNAGWRQRRDQTSHLWRARISRLTGIAIRA
jgi:hypothetical protein